MIPSVLMKNFLLMISHLSAIFDADEAVTLVFDLVSVEETADAEEAGLFGHVLTSIF